MINLFTINKTSQRGEPLRLVKTKSKLYYYFFAIPVGLELAALFAI